MTKKTLLALAAALTTAAPGVSYADVALNVGGGLMVTPQLGYQKIKGPFSGAGSHTDYPLTLSKDVSGFVISAAVVGTDADKAFYSSPVNGKELGKTSLVVGVKYNF